MRIGVIKDFNAHTRETDVQQCEYLVTMTEKTLEVADFTYLTVSQDSGYLWDFKFKFACKQTQPYAYHIAFLTGYNKNLVIARGQEQLFFSVSEHFVSSGPMSNAVGALPFVRTGTVAAGAAGGSNEEASEQTNTTAAAAVVVVPTKILVIPPRTEQAPSILDNLISANKKNEAAASVGQNQVN